MSGGLLKALRSDSYVELSQYRDQHFRVSEAGPREGEVPGQNAENWLAFVSLCRLPFSLSRASVPTGEWMLKGRLVITKSLSLLGGEFETPFYIPW